MTTITIPRAVVEQALEALDAFSWEQVDAARIALRAALAQPEPEPVACKPLTEEEIRTIGRTYSTEVWADDGWSIDFARAIEAAHGIIETWIKKDKA